MAQKVQTISPTGKLNWDDSYETMPSGDCHERWHSELSEVGKYGKLTNMKGDRLWNLGLTATEYVVGSCYDAERDQFLYLISNTLALKTGRIVSAKETSIAPYYTVTSLFTYVNFFENYTTVAQATETFVDCKMIGDIWISTDGINEPKAFDLITQPSPIQDDTISMIRPAPRYAPSVAVTYDVDVEDSSISNNSVYQFAHSYVYNDDTDSVMSPYSEETTSDESLLVTQGGSYYNKITVTAPIDRENIKQIKLYVREISEAVSNFYLVETFSITASEIVNDNLIYNFYGNVSSVVETNVDALTIQSSLPYTSEALELIQNNAIALAGNTEGYNIVPTNLGVTYKINPDSGAYTIQSTITPGTIDPETFTISPSLKDNELTAVAFSGSPASKTYYWGLVDGGTDVVWTLYDGATPMGSFTGTNATSHVGVPFTAEAGGISGTITLIRPSLGYITEAGAIVYSSSGTSDSTVISLEARQAHLQSIGLNGLTETVTLYYGITTDSTNVIFKLYNVGGDEIATFSGDKTTNHAVGVLEEVGYSGITGVIGLYKTGDRYIWSEGSVVCTYTYTPRSFTRTGDTNNQWIDLWDVSGIVDGSTLYWGMVVDGVNIVFQITDSAGNWLAEYRGLASEDHPSVALIPLGGSGINGAINLQKPSPYPYYTENGTFTYTYESTVIGYEISVSSAKDELTSLTITGLVSLTTLYWAITLSGGNVIFGLYNGSSVLVASFTGSGSTNLSGSLTEEGSSGIGGTIGLTKPSGGYDEQYGTALFTPGTSTKSYTITTTQDAYVAQIADILLSGVTVDTIYYYQLEINGANIVLTITDINSTVLGSFSGTHTTAHIGVRLSGSILNGWISLDRPGGGYEAQQGTIAYKVRQQIFGDKNHNITGVAILGVTSGNTDQGYLYWTLTSDTLDLRPGGLLYYRTFFTLFSDSHQTNAVAVFVDVSTSIKDFNNELLTEAGSSGITGIVTLSATSGVGYPASSGIIRTSCGGKTTFDITNQIDLSSVGVALIFPAIKNLYIPPSSGGDASLMNAVSNQIVAASYANISSYTSGDDHIVVNFPTTVISLNYSKKSSSYKTGGFIDNNTYYIIQNFFDKYGRIRGISNIKKVQVPYFTQTDVAGITTYGEESTAIQLTINDALPSYCDTFSFAIAPDKKYWKQFIVPCPTVDSLIWDATLANTKVGYEADATKVGSYAIGIDYFSISKDLGAYEFNEGDSIRITAFESAIDQQYTFAKYSASVLGHMTTDSGYSVIFVDSAEIISALPLIQGADTADRYIFEIYRNNATTVDNVLFLECTNRYLAANYPVSSVINLYNGTAFYVPYYQSSTLTEYIKTTRSQKNARDNTRQFGKPISFSDRAAIKYYNSVRNGGKYFENTEVNNLFKFNYKDNIYLSDIYGDIKRLSIDGNTLRVYQNKKTASIYIGGTEIANQDGTTQIIRSDKVLGSYRYSNEDYGLQIKTAFVDTGKCKYFFDLYNGCIVKDNNGMMAITGRVNVGDYSNDFKMERYFKTVSNYVNINATTLKKNFKVVLGYNNDNHILFVTSPYVSYPTIAFSEEHGYWYQFLDIVPRMYTNGGLKTTYQTATNFTYRMFDENVNRCYIGGGNRSWIYQVCANDNGKMKKVYDAITVDTNSPALCTIDIEANGTYDAMKSRVKKGRYRKEEGIYRAEILRNMLPNSTAYELYNGNVMRGSAALMTFSEPSASLPMEVLSVDVYYTDSSQ